MGLPYGIVREGAPSESDAEVASILEEAVAHGFGGVDTATAYGSAPRRLGAFLRGRPELSSWRICTKLIAGDSASSLRDLWEGHTRELGRESVFALLLHRPCEADRPPVRDFCFELRRTMRVERLGVSVYEAGELELALRLGFGEAVELPLNAFSLPRWEGEASMLRDSFVIARSVFLQGVLLRAPSELPSGVRGLSECVARFQGVCASHGLSPIEGALCAVAGVPWVSAVAVGADSRRQVGEIADAWGVARGFLQSGSDMASFLEGVGEVASSADPSAIDPRLWKR